MQADIKLLRFDNESDEPEAVFEIIPTQGNGVYRKNRWLVRVALSFCDPENTWTYEEMTEEGRSHIKNAMGINHDNS